VGPPSFSYIYFLTRPRPAGSASLFIKKITAKFLIRGFIEQQSGSGGTFTLPTTNILPPGGEFGSIPIGAPFFGHDDKDTNICNESVPSKLSSF
jgi:hypothetical protein